MKVLALKPSPFAHTPSPRPTNEGPSPVQQFYKFSKLWTVKSIYGVGINLAGAYGSNTVSGATAFIQPYIFYGVARATLIAFRTAYNFIAHPPQV